MGSSLIAHSDFPRRNSPPWIFTLKVPFFSSISMTSICSQALPFSLGGTSLSAKGINNLDHFTNPLFFSYSSSANEYHLSCFRSFSNFFCSESSFLDSSFSTTGSVPSSSHSSFSL
jgi:hypothetical protein